MNTATEQGTGKPGTASGPGSPWLFGSFFLGGFECSTHRTAEGRRMDLIAQTQHDRQAREDYALCRAVGIRAVREAARWPRIDSAGRFDLSDVRRLARLGGEAGLTLIWDLFHYGYPNGLDPLDGTDEFVERFAAYARAVACVVRAETPGPTWYTPVNEISYFAWSGGEVAYMAPFGRGRGPEMKRALVRTAIAGTNAIWEVDPDARVLNVDPLVHLHAPLSRPDLRGEAEFFNQSVVTEAFDLLAGRREPELGGSRAHLGVVGLNYYADNQWTVPTPEEPFRFLDPDDPRRVSLSDLLASFQERYGGPILLGETGSWEDRRGDWITYLAREAQRARAAGVDLQGICLYPVVTSPDWEDTTAFYDGGFFDVVPEPDGRLRRVLVPSLAHLLREAQGTLDPGNLPADPPAIEPAPPVVRLDGPLPLVRPLEHTVYKTDNYSYQVLLAGERLILELYCFEPGYSVFAHRHQSTEHVLTVLSGEARVHLGGQDTLLRPGEALLIPAGVYHGIYNDGAERLVVQQVSSPKPWDARFGEPHPGNGGLEF